MALPNEKENFRNLFPDIVVDNITMADFWRAWQISQEFKDKVKIFDTFVITDQDRWDTIAEQVYNDRRLWWLLILFNEIEDPFSIYFEENIPEAVKTIKIVKPSDVGILLAEIRNARLKFE